LNRINQISETEVTNNINLQLIETYYKHDVEYVNWVTAGDEHVCPLCEDLEENNPYLLSDMKGLNPPKHPSCRCHLQACDNEGDPLPDKTYNVTMKEKEILLSPDKKEDDLR
jgi:SPP1 gp7 family putative phage head morphogenesis protein